MGPAPLVLLAAALTGVATLAAEMLWIRGLGRGIGTTYEALALVAGLFLAGLGLGALLGARLAPRTSRPARHGTWLLAGAGTWIALSPLYVAALPDLRALLFSGESGGLLPALTLELPLVLPAALCLGAVFPYLVRARVEDVAHAGSRTGWIYAANTAGALVGVVGLLPVLASVGETMALRLCGAVALLAAFLLLLADRPLPHGDGPPKPATPGQALGASGLRWALFTSGGAALLAQMAWFRMLEPLAGEHLQGIALLLAPLLLALAVGAAVAGPIADRMRRPSYLMPLLLAGAGALTLLSLPTAGNAPLSITTGAADGSRVAALAWAFLMTVAPATLAFGALLPAAVRLRALWTGSTSGPAGRLYAWNALGALSGSLVAGYLLLPRVGAERTLFIAAVLVVATAVILRWRVPGPRRHLAALAHALPLLVLLWPGLLQGWLASGPTPVEVITARKPLPAGLTIRSSADFELYARWFTGRRAQRPGDASGTALPVFEGRGGRIALIEEADGPIGMRRGALRESLFNPDRPNAPALTEHALGLLPTLLHGAPEQALVIGHGAGWTAEAVLAAGARTVTVAEIDSSVLDAARAARGLEQLPVERLSHARVVSADGRTMLRAGLPGKGYDVIASQPSHPWHPASGHLFTVEAFREARSALSDDGVHAQWLNLFDMTPELLFSALASYRAAFEHVWIFRFPGEIVLLGFRQEPALRAARWEAFFAETNPRAEGARAAGFERPGHLLKHFALDTATLDRMLPRGVDLLQDDVPRLALELAARRLRGAAPVDVDEPLRAAFPPDLATHLPHSTTRERWITDAVLGWLDQGARDEANRWARKLRWGFTPEGRSAQARAALAAGEGARAEVLMSAALRATPERGDVAELWIRAATALVGQGPEAAREARLEQAKALAARMPDNGPVLAALARMLRFMGRIEESLTTFERAVGASNPEPPDRSRIQFARILLSQAYSKKDEARAAELLAADPATYLDIDTLDLLVRMTTSAGEESKAAALEKTLLTLQRTRGLALLRTASGHLARHEFPLALEAARRCCIVWASQPEAFELRGLAALAWRAAPDTAPAARADFEKEARQAFASAAARSDDPRTTLRRGHRILSWFGLDPAPAAPRPEEGAE